MDFTFITGNDNKVKALEHWLGRPVKHQKIDLDELQILDDAKVVTHKAEQAYKIISSPVLVEDVYLSFNALGKLPGTYIKWFLQELSPAGCCKLLNSFADRSAIARVTYCFYDGQTSKLFASEVKGTISDLPRGQHGFGWDSIFIPDGDTQTYAERNHEEGDSELLHTQVRGVAAAKLKEFLDSTKL